MVEEDQVLQRLSKALQDLIKCPIFYSNRQLNARANALRNYMCIHGLFNTGEHT